MTARHQVRIGNRRLGRDRAPIDATPAPRVGEQLQLARERKGVDLFRAERDTKIRLRYLSALEDSDYDELPAAVYTKGFLRNYAIYLGLDPDEVLERWREEMDAMKTGEHIAVAPPPMPMVEPGRRLTITPGMLVAGLVLLVVLAFVGYLGLQLVRYAETTPISLTYPPNVVSQIAAPSVTLTGTAGPGALITIDGPAGETYNTTADEHGAWSKEVTLGPGRNDFNVTATDPVTQRRSAALALTINVPLPSPSPTASASPTQAPPVALALNLLGPAEGVTSTDGKVIIRGTTNGERLTITSQYMGTPDSSPQPSGLPLGSPTPGPTHTPTPSGAPAPSASPPIGPARDVIITTTDGSFAEELDFTPGRWQLTVTAFSTGLNPVVQVRNITVAPPAPVTVQVQLQVVGSNASIRLSADGTRVPGYNGVTLHPGDQAGVTANEQVCIHTDNAGALHVFVNSADLGLLGASGQTGNWLITRLDPHPVSVTTGC